MNGIKHNPSAPGITKETKVMYAVNADYAESANYATSASSAAYATIAGSVENAGNAKLMIDSKGDPINEGNTSSPVYFYKGKPVECEYDFIKQSNKVTEYSVGLDSETIVNGNSLSIDATGTNSPDAKITLVGKLNNIRLTTSESSGNAGLFCLDGMPGPYRNKTAGRWFAYIKSDGTAVFETSSDKRLKNHIADLSEKEANILLRNVNPIIFDYKADKEGKNHQYGFYAQDFKNIMLENNINYKNFLIINSAKGEDTFYYDLSIPEEDVIYGLDYAKLTPVLWKGWQNHEEEISILKKENQELKDRIKKIEEKLKDID